MTTAEDLYWMRQALHFSRQCPFTPTAFNVGAVIVIDGQQLAFGYARETSDKVHAEEAALAKLAGASLANATIYTTLEPCSKRASRPLTCTQLILDAGIRRVVYAYREPPVFVDCEGVEILTAAGVTVIETPELAADVVAVNTHLIS